MDSEYVTIDGNANLVFIDNVIDYNGLIMNGNQLASMDAKSNITIQNIGIISTGTTTLTNGYGWIGQAFYGYNATNDNIINCYSTGDINSNCGGIVGSSSSNTTIANCYSTGTISQYAGGIMGSGVSNSNITNCYSNGSIGLGAGGIIGSNTINCNISSCYSFGTIGNEAGGICGRYSSYCNITNSHSIGSIGSNAGGIIGIYSLNLIITNCYSSGNIAHAGGGICSDSSTGTITNCFSTGAITDTYAGGITGYSFVGSIENSYSSGEISGTYAGGIVGDWFGYNSNATSSIINCYSTGNITGINAGGITGAQVGYNDNAQYTPTVIINNCYSTGVASNGCGTIFGGTESGTYTNIPNITMINSYSIYFPMISSTLQIINDVTITNSGTDNGIWSNTNASSYLSGGPTYSSGTLVNPTGTTWADVGTLVNTSGSWIFSTLGLSPYTNSLTSTFSQSIEPGQSTISALVPLGHTFTIVSINDLDPINFPGITIEQFNQITGGTISTTSATPTGLYSLKILRQSDYSITNFDLNLNSPCYLDSTKILCKINGIEQYIQIKDIEPNKNIFVKTHLHGYKKVIYNLTIKLQNSTKKTIHKLYKLSKEKNANLFEDLFISGQHSILVDSLTFMEEKEMKKQIKNIIIDDKKLLMANVGKQFEPVNDNNLYQLHQLVLENENSKGQYGIYSNGILSETMSLHVYHKKYKSN